MSELHVYQGSASGMIINTQCPPKPKPGDVVAVEAVDWGIVNEQYPRDSEWSFVRGTIYGEVLVCNDVQLTIAFQVFEDGGVRGVLSLPWVTIVKWMILLEAPEGERAQAR